MGRSNVLNSNPTGKKTDTSGPWDFFFSSNNIYMQNYNWVYTMNKVCSNWKYCTFSPCKCPSIIYNNLLIITQNQNKQIKISECSGISLPN